MLLLLIGVSIGIAGALALAKLISGFLYGLAPTDGPTLLVVLLLFAAIAFVSTYAPARRAANVDPMAALRCE